MAHPGHHHPRALDARSGHRRPHLDTLGPGGPIVTAEQIAQQETAPAASRRRRQRVVALGVEEARDRKEHTSELQSLMRISYAVFCLKKKKITMSKTQQNITA